MKAQEVSAPEEGHLTTDQAPRAGLDLSSGCSLDGVLKKEKEEKLELNPTI